MHGWFRRDRKSMHSKVNDLDFTAPRERMVQSQLAARGIGDPGVLKAFRKVPRHLFVAPEYRTRACEDHPLPIGFEQTISQPFVVAYMLQALELGGTEQVLEIGTGCGYQTALLAELSASVCTVEFFPALSARAKRTLRQLAYTNIYFSVGDGARGWPHCAGPKFDAIIASAAPREIPPALYEQLMPGGRMILPLGSLKQELVLVRRNAGERLKRETLIPVRFVPMQEGCPPGGVSPPPE